MSTSPPPVEPPDGVHVRQRYIRREMVEWAKECDRIMLAHGVVVGSLTYSTFYRARYHVRNLKRIMEATDMHPTWQLHEHVEKIADGWVWSLEYIGRRDD